jgi:hypothetical protein
MTFVKKHGLTDSIEHRAWARIRRRCYSPDYHNYPRYGGRGIEVCERWNDFNNFLADMGPRPGPEYTIERIDNDGDYEPCNCRWATRLEQARNKTNTYTAEEDQIIKDGIAKGLNLTQIAALLPHRPKKGVASRVYRIGLKSGVPPIPKKNRGPEHPSQQQNMGE